MEIKEICGHNPEDIMADINVADTSACAKHTVNKDETLGNNAKHYYGDASKYHAIFNANT